MTPRASSSQRHAANPILTADDWPYPVNAVFNPAAAQVDGTTVLLARVEDLTGISHLTVARSANGVDGWTIDPEPLLAPTDGIESEQWGFEDARVVFVPELERWVITCTAYGPAGPAVYLATTEDFRSVERHGIVRQPEDKNAALLPERVDGKWILFHRPKTEFGGPSRARSSCRAPPTSISWSAPEQVLQPREGAWWDSLRIGIGPPPLRTEHGWLLIYHGVKETVAGGVYRVGLALSTSTSRPACCTGCPDWILGAAPRRTSARATCRTSSSRAGSSTTPRPTSSGSTTAPPTRRSASPRRGSAICSQPCWPRRASKTS